MVVNSHLAMWLSLQSSLTDDLAERTENEKIHLTAAQEENEKLREILQSEINEYKVVITPLSNSM